MDGAADQGAAAAGSGGLAVKIAYFMNTYPMTSTTFVRDEILQLEAVGVTVPRFALRRFDQPLVSEADRRELDRTTYLLDGRLRLAGALICEAVSNPRGLLRALGTWFRLWGNDLGSPVAHLAYLLEAVRLKQETQATGVDHLHTHFSTNSAAVALLCQRLGGPRYSFTAHGPREFYDRHKASLALKIEHAAFVAAISNHAKSILLERAGIEAWDKIPVVRCGVNLVGDRRDEGGMLDLQRQAGLV
ncbi:MAG: glycosyltransferase family 4 protein, partial [Pseudomonadota bacterium]